MVGDHVLKEILLPGSLALAFDGGGLKTWLRHLGGGVVVSDEGRRLIARRAAGLQQHHSTRGRGKATTTMPVLGFGKRG